MSKTRNVRNRSSSPSSSDIPFDDTSSHRSISYKPQASTVRATVAVNGPGLIRASSGDAHRNSAAGQDARASTTTAGYQSHTGESSAPAATLPHNQQQARFGRRAEPSVAASKPVLQSNDGAPHTSDNEGESSPVVSLSATDESEDIEEYRQSVPTRTSQQLNDNREQQRPLSKASDIVNASPQRANSLHSRLSNGTPDSNGGNASTSHYSVTQQQYCQEHMPTSRPSTAAPIRVEDEETLQTRDRISLAKKSFFNASTSSTTVPSITLPYLSRSLHVPSSQPESIISPPGSPVLNRTKSSNKHATPPVNTSITNFAGSKTDNAKRPASAGTVSVKNDKRNNGASTPESRMVSPKRRTVGLFAKFGKTKEKAPIRLPSAASLGSLPDKVKSEKGLEFDQVLVSNDTQRVTLTPVELVDIDNRDPKASMAFINVRDTSGTDESPSRKGSRPLEMPPAVITQYDEPKTRSSIPRASLTAQPVQNDFNTHNVVPLAANIQPSAAGTRTSYALEARVNEERDAKLIESVRDEISLLRSNGKDEVGLREAEARDLTIKFQKKVSGLERELSETREALSKMKVYLSDVQTKFAEQRQAAAGMHQTEKARWEESRQAEVAALRAQWQLECDAAKEQVRFEMLKNSSADISKLKSEYDREMNALRKGHAEELARVVSTNISQMTANTTTKFTAELESMTERVECSLKAIQVMKDRTDVGMVESVKARERALIQRESELSAQMETMAQRGREHEEERLRVLSLVASLEQALRMEKSAREAERLASCSNAERSELEMSELRMSLQIANERLTEDRRAFNKAREEFISERRRMINAMDDERRHLAQEKAALQSRVLEVQEREQDQRQAMIREHEGANEERAWIDSERKQLRRRETEVATESLRVRSIEIQVENGFAKLASEREAFEAFRSALEREAAASRQTKAVLMEAEVVRNEANRVFEEMEGMLIQAYNEREMAESLMKRVVEERLRLAQDRDEGMKSHGALGSSYVVETAPLEIRTSQTVPRDSKGNGKKVDEWDSIQRRLIKAVNRLPMDRRQLRNQGDFLSAVDCS
ncbi:hypothetical protein SeMB42_g06572 [Synchytrium endobioticum]|uniref:Fas-binding factor 1 C-terminal domain-containing protein n=1 Tax=Synchytrium endobioticum TaxID=286115 RepID=A0A507CAZ5_9FUNG|nr:hypothetical protein SeLEV6574_g07729 [Synchytrium endobioticum]TPX38750.1 hypothetical protein SeMB42_g06572 [Synchytrium endobioticum]